MDGLVGNLKGLTACSELEVDGAWTAGFCRDFGVGPLSESNEVSEESSLMTSISESGNGWSSITTRSVSVELSLAMVMAFCSGLESDGSGLLFGFSMLTEFIVFTL